MYKAVINTCVLALITFIMSLQSMHDYCHIFVQGHEVDAFGIGTNLVTCYAQAALGCVFKLVEINKQPRIKLSEDVSKVCMLITSQQKQVSYLLCIQTDRELSCLLQVSIPCKKKCYRLYGKEGYPLVDIMTGEDEPGPKVNNIHVNA